MAYGANKTKNFVKQNFLHMLNFKNIENPIKLMENILKEIQQFADMSHGNQMRKYSSERYIVHPIRVMKLCRQYDNRLPILAAALLHDVLEDTPINEHELLSFLETLLPREKSIEILSLVKELTDVYIKKAYPHWNRQKRKQMELKRIEQTSSDSQTIKYADIIDNCEEIAANDPDFAPRFLKECLANLSVANKGNSMLYKVALDKVKNELKTIQE